MTELLRGLWQEETGQDLNEYGLMVLLVSLSSVTATQKAAAAMQVFISAVGSIFTNTSANLADS